ncbi:MAG: competence/damage-inducible protein A [Desulfamplus sp.]|nr:competence/damage-inducible protein A [Desulfamplus sp.]
MKAEIFSTGDEVLWGDIDDTNASWLARKLRESGIDVTRITCTGDCLEDIAGIIQEMSARADIALVTGGLGPTSDDLSAEAAALASGDTIVLNQKALTSMKSYFSKRGIKMSDDNKKQAMLPSKAGVMENSFGTAPGFHISCNRAAIFFMPGVPREMKPMYEKSVLPQIRELFAANTAVNSTCLVNRFKVFGLPESRVGSRLKGFNEHFPQLKLGFRSTIPLIEVKFSTISRDVSQSQKQMEQASQWISSRLDGYIFSSTGLSMEQELGRALAARKKTLAVAESCTGGLIGNMITDVEGSSDYFLFCAVTYSNDAKVNILGVSPDTLTAHGAVHEQTAMEMAQGARRVAGADYGLATSGIAGPGGGTDEKPVGTVCIGIAGDGFSKAYRFNFSFGDRIMNKKFFAVKAMDMLRREVLKIS